MSGSLFMLEHNLQRRVAGHHDLRMDGMTDLLTRAKGRSVFDVGCNRGLVAYEFANNGAKVAHGCDIYEEGVAVARHLFADLRNCDGRFEVVDLTGGAAALDKAFGGETAGQKHGFMKYDIVVCLATYHKLKRVMKPEDLSALFQFFGRKTNHYFAWRATSDKPEENALEMAALNDDMKVAGLNRIHTSYISKTLGVCAIWERQGA